MRRASVWVASFNPLHARGFISVAFAFATLFCIVVPRVGPLVVISVTTALSIFLLLKNGQRDARTWFERYLFRPENLFVLWAAIACSWSPEPLPGLLKVLFLAVLTLHAIILANKFHSIDTRDIEAAAHGLLVGFILGGIYLCLEIDSRDILTRYVLTGFPELDRAIPGHARYRDGVIVRLSVSHITRVNAVFCLFVCPALLAATLYTKGLARWLCYAAVAFFLLFVFLHPNTNSQTSQLVVFVIAAAVALGFLAPRFVRWAVAAGFAIWLLLIVPASIAMYSSGLHQNKELFRTARARVIIWNDTAEAILERPIFGRGTYSAHSYILSPEARRELRAEKLSGGSHPHSLYLQIWFEFGLIGALAFGLLAYSLWVRLSQLPKRIAVLATAHFAVCMTIIGPSYGLWQNWFQSVIVASILVLILIMTPAIRLEEPKRPIREPQGP